MDLKDGKRAIVAVAVAGILAARAMAADGKEAELTQTFEFRDVKTSNVLVTGTERMRREGPLWVKHTEYREGGGTVANEDTRYDAATFKLDAWSFADVKSGEMAAVTVKDGRADVSYRARKDKEVDRGTIDWTQRSLHGKSLPELLLKSWDRLKAGELVEFDLYVPFRMETIGFRAALHDQPMVRSESKLLSFRIEAANFVIRQVAPTLYFTFEDSPERRLVHYRGPSMVDIAGEKSRIVDIFFR